MDANWDLYRSFLAVLRTGSLSAASRHLGLTQPTVGRHIGKLEESMGKLFTRSQTGLLPTKLALRMKIRAEALEVDIAALIREASHDDSESAGVVRITASEIVSTEWLPKLIAKIQELHPQLKIELVGSNKVQNLLTREADIAIRMVEPTQEALISKKIGEVEIGLHAHRDYLKRIGPPEKIEDLSHHKMIGFDRENHFIRSVQKKLGSFAGREQFSIKTDSDVAQLALIRSGCGIGFCQVHIAEKEKNLVRVLPKVGFKLGVWLVMHEDLKDQPACFTLFRELATVLKG